MAFKHGKDSVVLLNAVDLSTFVNNVEFNRSADSHDVTTLGKQSHVYQGGLKDGECTIEGIYDDGAAGPRATIVALLGTVVTFVHRPEGTGAGKPMDTVDVLVMEYAETEPVDEMISWSCELQLSDDVATTDQV